MWEPRSKQINPGGQGGKSQEDPVQQARGAVWVVAGVQGL